MNKPHTESSAVSTALFHESRVEGRHLEGLTKEVNKSR